MHSIGAKKGARACPAKDGRDNEEREDAGRNADGQGGG